MLNKDALEYLVNLGTDNNPVVNVSGLPFSVKPLYPVKKVGPEPLELNFLDSLITYLHKATDSICEENTLIIEIKSPTEIALHTEIVGSFNERFTLVNCIALIDSFPWGRFLDPDTFIIMAQSRFLETEDLAKVRAIVGNVRSDEVIQFSDDGISQQVNIKSGIARVDPVVVPPRVKLAPYRTFIEIEQPVSEFVFRARKADGLPHFALFEADGGAWRVAAMKRIKDYLESHLKEVENVVILG
jgi:hypothetical protein